MSLRIKNIVSKKTIPLIIILTGIFLRFYHFQDFVTFLGDQGRDAIVLKRILTLEHLPAIGAPSSLGQIYLGPFYYYLIAPFLFLFNFNPVGPAFGVAFISMIGIIITYMILKKEFDFRKATIFLIFAVFSLANIQLARFSWNPNLLPVFSFFTLYFFYKSLKSKDLIYYITFGAFFSFSIQMHYLSILLFIPILFVYLFQNRFNLKKDLSKILSALISFSVLSLPLIVFDLRHQFLNSRNFIKLFTERSFLSHDSYFDKLLATNQAFYSHIFQLNLNSYIAFIISVFILVIYIKKYRLSKNIFLHINFINFFFYLVIFSILNTTRLVHYFGPIYFSFYIVIAYILSDSFKNKLLNYFFITAVIFIYIVLNIRNSVYLFKSGPNQIAQAERVASSIILNRPKSPYQLIALPYLETDGHIRYFLEIKGYKPLAEDTLENPKELYVLCFEKNCRVLGNPQWQVASFKNAKIDKIWNTEGIKIYKLIHAE